jgi:hypothetical protein
MSPVELPLVVHSPAGRSVAPPSERHGQLVRRARMLVWLGIGWHVAEAAIAIIAGLAATSIALIGFGADSLIESVAGLIVVWRFAEARQDSDAAERRAQHLIGASFAAIGVYVAVEAARSLLAGTHPDASWVGIGLAVVTLATMPLLARAKARVGDELHSSATVSEGRQNFFAPTCRRDRWLGLAPMPCSAGGGPIRSPPLPSPGSRSTRAAKPGVGTPVATFADRSPRDRRREAQDLPV